MRVIWTIFKKEWSHYFNSPIAIIYLITFWVLSSWLFFRSFFISNQANMRLFFDMVPWLFLFLIPAISMRVWSEEKKDGTLDFLFTFPVREIELIIGKFKAAAGLVLLTLAGTLPLVCVCGLVGEPDYGPIFTGYLGAFFLAIAYLSIGFCLSALTKNQIIAFILTLTVSFIFLILSHPLILSSLPQMPALFFRFLSFSYHFESMKSGVLDIRDFIYYLCVILFFLYLNLHILNEKKIKMSSLAFKILETAAVFSILVMFNAFILRIPLRIDLTEHKIFTLDSSTKSVIRQLDDIVRIHFYISETFPAHLSGIKYAILDLLKEYSVVSKGKIKVEITDPSSDSKKIQEIRHLGLFPIQMNVIQKDKLEVMDMYSGIALFYENKVETIPVVLNLDNLEYDLTAAIKKIISKVTHHIALLSDPSRRNVETHFSQFAEQLKKHYDVQTVSINSPIPPETETAVVISPKNATEDFLRSLDHFMMKGGHTVFLIDRIDIHPGLIAEPIDSGLEPFLLHHGVQIQKNLMLDTQNAAATFSLGSVDVRISYPLWPKLTASSFDKNHPIMRKIESLVLPWSVSIAFSPPSSPVSRTVLASTSPGAWEMIGYYNLNPRQRFYSPETRTFPMIALATDSLSSPYSHASPPERSPSVNMAVIGGSEFLTDSMVSQFPFNMTFMLNLIDWVTLKEQISGIRSKITPHYPLRETSPKERFLLKWSATLGASFFLALFGLARFIQRKRLRKTRKGT